MPKVGHRQHKALNNRAENSHVPIRKRERFMQGFRYWPALQQFVSTFSAVRDHFVPPRSHRSALSTHLHRLRAMSEWIRHSRCLKIDRIGHAAANGSLRDIAVHNPALTLNPAGAPMRRVGTSALAGYYGFF
jgi:hypothetical protein